MKLKRSKKFGNDEQGSALLIALFALLLISAIGFGMLYSSTTETNVNANFRDSQRAYFAARAGLEEARLRLLPTAARPITPPAGMPGTGVANIIYLKNPMGSETVDPTGVLNPDGTAALSGTPGAYFDDELCHEGFSGFSSYWPSTPTSGVPCALADGPQSTWLAAPVSSVSPGTSSTSALPYKWVRITTKSNYSGAPYVVDSAQASTNPGGQVCWDGLRQRVISAGTCTTQPTMMYPVWTLTSFAYTPQGSHKMAQMEVALDPPTITNAAVDSQAGVTTRGNLTVNGYDHCNCTDAGANLPGKTCDNSKYAIYTQGGLTENGSPNITSGTSPATMQNVPDSSWPYDINALIDKYKNMPNAVTPPGACSGSPGSMTCSSNQADTESWGATSSNFSPLVPGDMNPQITYLPGDSRLNGVTGAGILVVDGDLDVHGGLAWYGLILVKGTIDFTGGGSDHVNLYGAFLNGRDVNATNNLDDLGGSVVLHFDSCALKQFDQKYPPRNLATHELMY